MYTATRNKDLAHKCRMALRSMPPHTYIKFNNLVTQIINSEAPGYYVSFDYALRRINEIHKTGRSSVRNKINRMLWDEIYAKTAKALDSGRYRNIAHALTHVLVSEKASRFFISQQQAMRIFSTPRKTVKKKTS